MSVDLLSSSAQTWDEGHGQGERYPAELDASHAGGIGRRLSDLRHRYLLRRSRAEQTFAESRNPERGLPVASNGVVMDFLKELLGRRRAIIVALLSTAVLASVTGLIVPRILGSLVNRVQANDPTLAGALNGICLAAALVIVVQTVLTFLTRRLTAVFGQDLLSSAREQVVRTVLRLPLSKVETTGTGDLVTRVTRDVSAMAASAQWALPNFVIAGATAVLTMVALIWNSWMLAIPSLLGMGILAFSVRSYLKHAPAGYIAEGSKYSMINSSLTESIEGARTAEALGLQSARTHRTDDDLAETAQAERYTMSLRNLLFMAMDLAFTVPLAVTILVGGYCYAQGWVSLGQITTATLYIQALVSPMGQLVHTMDNAQVGLASTTRLLGIAEVPQDREVGSDSPVDSHLRGRDLRFAYREDHDVLHGVDLDLRVGERLAIVGPSGSGKSTLARLLSGINRPRTGEVTMGGVDVMDLPLEQLRTEVALVTQEHHVFVGSIRDNVVLARETSATDDEVREALDTVGALEWVERTPSGLRTSVGSGNLRLTPAQAQQIALARLIIADPHTLVLDEATSLIDPQSARKLESAMGALLTGRTVVAIAHRLHTAHDADRIAVVIDGKIAELGSHDELMAHGGEYAALWTAWTS